MPIFGRKVEKKRASVQIGTGAHQSLHDSEVSGLDCQHQRGSAVVVEGVRAAPFCSSEDTMSTCPLNAARWRTEPP